MNWRPVRSSWGYQTLMGGGVPAGVSPKIIAASNLLERGRSTSLVKAVRYTCERSLFSTRTTSSEPFGSASSKMYVPAGSAAPGICTERLNVKYVVRFGFQKAPVVADDNTPTST